MTIENSGQFLAALDRGPYAWPGGYPVYFVCADGGALSFEAARAEADLVVRAVNDRDARGRSSDPQWDVVAAEVNWEDPHLYCDHTGYRIESAHADDDVADDEAVDAPQPARRMISYFNTNGFLRDKAEALAALRDLTAAIRENTQAARELFAPTVSAAAPAETAAPSVAATFHHDPSGIEFRFDAGPVLADSDDPFVRALVLDDECGGGTYTDELARDSDDVRVVGLLEIGGGFSVHVDPGSLREYLRTYRPALHDEVAEALFLLQS